MPATEKLIRPAVLSDAEGLARLSGQLGYPMSAAEMMQRLEGLLADERHHVAVALRAGSIVGWMHVEHRSSVESGARAELVGLVVDSGARRGGTGKALVAAAECWARSRDLPLLVVRSNVSRDLSHPFYEALGYSRVKTQHVYSKRLGPGREAVG